MVFFEIIKALFQTMDALLNGIIVTIWNMLPNLLEIKKVLGYFTPTGIIALALGVPTIVVTIAVFAIKTALKKIKT